MFLKIWRDYRDYRFQNPVCFEQARELDYKYILYNGILISREYEEEVICLTAGLFNEHTERIKNIIEDLKQSSNENMQYYDVAKAYKEIDFNKFIARKLKSVNKLGAITTEDYSKTDGDLYIERIVENIDAYTITSDYTIGADSHNMTDKILEDKTIDLILISKSCFNKFKDSINWTKTIVI